MYAIRSYYGYQHPGPGLVVTFSVKSCRPKLKDLEMWLHGRDDLECAAPRRTRVTWGTVGRPDEAVPHPIRCEQVADPRSETRSFFIVVQGMQTATIVGELEWRARNRIGQKVTDQSYNFV